MSETITTLRYVERALDGGTQMEYARKQVEFVGTEADGWV